MKPARNGEQVVVLTNASSPGGRQVAFQLARRGCFLVLAGTDQQALAALAKKIGQMGGVAHVVVADPSEREGKLRLTHEAIEWFGRIDKWVDGPFVEDRRNGRYVTWKTILAAACIVVAVGVAASRLRKN